MKPTLNDYEFWLAEVKIIDKDMEELDKNIKSIQQEYNRVSLLALEKDDKKSPTGIEDEILESLASQQKSLETKKKGLEELKKVYEKKIKSVEDNSI